jgi:hypothetical protein
MSSLEESLRRHVDLLCKEPRSPQSPGYFKSQAYLKDVLRGLGLEAKEHPFRVWGFDANCTNIYAESSAGSSPVTLIGAHYDARACSGLAADDNASAVAVAIETARNLLREKSTPFVLVFFDMEEIFKLQNLQGSKAFAKFYTRPIDRVVVLDLVGGALTPHFQNIYLQFGGALPALEGTDLEFLHLPMHILEPIGSIGARSDYDAFRKKKIPFTFISSGTPWYYHTKFDTPEVLMYAKMAGLTKCLTNALSKSPVHVDNSGTLEAFQKFLMNLRKTKVLNTPLVERLVSTHRLPSRLEMIRLYMHMLPTLRKHGRDLFQAPRG